MVEIDNRIIIIKVQLFTKINISLKSVEKNEEFFLVCIHIIEHEAFDLGLLDRRFEGPLLDTRRSSSVSNH